MKRVHRYTVILMMVSMLLALTCRAESPANDVAVFYPDVKEPYLSVFTQISQGIERANPAQTHTFLLAAEDDSDKLLAMLRRKGINKAITLGQSGYRLADKWHQDITVVCGALPIQPNGVSGISLSSDPAQLFHYLQLVAPAVTDIHVAYSENNRWLIERAGRIATTLAIRLHSVPVADVRAATRYYQSLFRKLDNAENHAIWLALDRIAADDQVVLPLVLRESWQKQVVVFSSTPAHAKRGVLFSTFPDNQAMGEHLLAMVNELHDAKPARARIEPLKSLQLAVNLRTAARLGLRYDSAELAQFSLTFQ